MPTGYTAPIYENEPLTFEEFTWRCARAMGALIEMRDDSMTAPIPTRLFDANDSDVSSGYYADRLRECEADLRELELLIGQPEEAEKRAEAEYASELADWEKSHANKNALRERYHAMRDKVRAWKPPSAEHDGLREYMSEQLSTSIQHDCYDDTEYKPKPRDGVTWLRETIASTQREAVSVRESLAKERERHVERAGWLNALAASVPLPAALKQK